MKGISTTYEEVAAYLEEHGERWMASMVRMQTEQLAACRQVNEANLRSLYALRAKYEPQPYRYPDYRSPPESDG